MVDRLSLDEDALAAAGAELVAAAQSMTRRGGRRPPGAFASLSGIGPEVEAHLGAVAVARGALADAARTAAEATGGLMRDAAELDARIAASLPAGFAVRGSSR